MITVIRNGTIVGHGTTRRADLWIEDDAVLGIGVGCETPDRTVDATGCYVLPGGIDPHVHMGFRVGEFLSSDDFATGSRAAAHGGVTTLIDFAVPEDAETTLQAVERRIREANGRCHVDYGVHAVVSRIHPNLDKDVRQCIRIGVPDFKTFTTYAGLRLSASDLLDVMGHIREVGGLILVHAEDDKQIQDRQAKQVEQGLLSPVAHYRSRPAEVEAAAVYEVLRLQAKTGCALHFVHISSAESVALIHRAQERGADVSAETCPQYLSQTCAVYEGPRAPHYMVSPSIKTAADRDRLWDGLRKKTLTMVATDHCPFTHEQKTRYTDFRQIPTGMPGVETTLPYLYTEWVARGWPLAEMVNVLSTQPARRFGLFPQKGTLVPEADADVVVFDPRPMRTVRAEDLHMNVDWNPFDGIEMRGVVRDVWLRGQPLIEQGKWIGDSCFGQFVSRTTTEPIGRRTAES